MITCGMKNKSMEQLRLPVEQQHKISGTKNHCGYKWTKECYCRRDYWWNKRRVILKQLAITRRKKANKNILKKNHDYK